MKKILFVSLITFWVGLCLFVRLVGLDKSPISVGFDEAALGYNSYSLMLTGKDEYGTPYPLSLRSFNDFKPALYSYLSIPFIYFFDLNQASTRALSAVLGTTSLIFLLLIFKQISKSSWKISLLVLTVISFFPWRLHFSRAAFESNISMAFFTITVWCLMNFKKNIFFKIGTILFSTLAIYSYHSARLAIPILLVFVIFDSIWPNIKNIARSPLQIIRQLWPLFAVLILYIPLFLNTQANNLLTRFSQTNMFSHYYPFAPQELTMFKNAWLNILGTPIYYLGGILVGHIFAYLSPQNLSLLIYPGVIKSAQVISGSGMLGFLGGMLFIVGLAVSFESLVQDKEKRILLYWILAGVIPAAVTWEWFYPLRSLNIYPAIDCIAGFGLLWIINKFLLLKNKFIKISFTALLLIIIGMSSIYNLTNELNYAAFDTNGEFQPGGYKEGAPLLVELKDKYQTIYIDTPQAQNYELFWFYMKYPPEKVQNIAYKRNKPGVEGPATFDYDNIIYKKFDWPSDKNKTNFIFWTSSEVKDEEIKSTPGAKLYRIQGPLGNWPVSIITKE